MILSAFSTVAFCAALVCTGAAPESSVAEPVLAIVDCTVFDPETEQLLPGRTIVIRGQHIVSVDCLCLAESDSPGSCADRRPRQVCPAGTH